MHALGAAVFGETYNLRWPTVTKMLDGGRNTDMPSGLGGARGFPSMLHEMVVAQNASGLEPLLRSTVDVFTSWGGVSRTEPHSGGPAAVAGLKAAATALLANYYVVRMGPDCTTASPSVPWAPDMGPGYGPNPPGDEWPGGCFGDWIGAKLVAPTLRALNRSRALRPGTPRQAVEIAHSSGCEACAYAALRSHAASADAALVAFNFAPTSVEVTLAPLARVGVVGNSSTDLIRGGRGPALDPQRPWTLKMEPRGWVAYAVRITDS